MKVNDSMRRGTWRGLDIGDLVVSSSGRWHIPRLVIEIHDTARSLVGVLAPDGEIKYIHYKHLEVISESR